MAEKISDNVGKKIVEALRMQNKQIDEPIAIEEEQEEKIEAFENFKDKEKSQESLINTTYSQPKTNIEDADDIIPDINSFINNSNSLTDIDSTLQNTINQNLGNINVSEIQSDFEFPNNVAILTHLISKLPTGVTKQTGAIIIKQTMEALGIPMKSVIREAQQVQEALANRTRECQKNVIDYRKQIATLEIKAQQYQKQAVVMNDIINLFINTRV